MNSFNSILTMKVSSLGGKIQDEANELTRALYRANLDPALPEPQIKLRSISKSLSELTFVRTELLLAAERKKRRTL